MEKMLDSLGIEPYTAVVAAVAGAVVLFVMVGGFSSSSSTSTSSSSSSVSETGLEKDKWKKFLLIEKSNVSHNTRRFKFALESPTQILGLPVGKHMQIRIPGLLEPEDASDPSDDRDHIEKPYTPTSSDDEKGYFSLVIKIYPDGQLTPYLDKLKVNEDVIDVEGPRGRISYTNPGEFSVERVMAGEARRFPMLTKREDGIISGIKQICMIAGGTGITPMLQVMAQVAKNGQDSTQVYMIFGNVSVNDILVRDELESLVAQNDNIHVCFTVDKGPENADEWKGDGKEVGFVTQEMVTKYFPEPNDNLVVLECGPPIMMKFINKFLEPMGYRYLNF